MTRPNWARAPKESAAPWIKLGFYEQAVGLQLVIQLEAHDGTGEGLLESSVERLLRGCVQNRNERQRIRQAVATLQDAGLVFEHEGLVYVLYAHRAWVKHRALGQRIAEERRAAGLKAVAAVPQAVTIKAREAGKSSATKRARQPANDNAHALPQRCPSVDPALTQNELNSGNRSGHLSGERERRSEKTASSLAASPSGPLPSVVSLEAERAKRESPKPPPAPPAKVKPPGSRRAAWQRIVEMFNERYQKGGNEGRSDVKNKGQFNLLVGTYLLADGSLNETLVAKSLDAYFAEKWWTKAPPGRTAPVGHSLHAWMLRHEEYDQRTTLPPKAPSYDRFGTMNQW